MTWIVRGVTREGKEVFYTGRAGAGFVSPEKAEAFTYETLEAACGRAAMLGRGELLHGIKFWSVAI